MKIDPSYLSIAFYTRKLFVLRYVTGQLGEVMSLVICVINFIVTRASTDRQFKALLDEVENKLSLSDLAQQGRAASLACESAYHRVNLISQIGEKEEDVNSSAVDNGDIVDPEKQSRRSEFQITQKTGFKLLVIE
ncbi:unnamed protein product [Dibothriocephalus latus]|uniref:Uncharacterized protein n=1 Tax=Dibothriocephalus latus TaxID=60516 RepID=A0A3P7LHY4_DIBLA|nr:unnamed protein product [Dibothriocephalus latus]